MKFYVAPVQGHTDAAWRHFHHLIYGGDLKYFTPFMRCEHGEIRQKDLRDFTNDLNVGIDLEPQVIFSNVEELETLLKPLVGAGVKAVNLNMGCPFPLQTRKGRGAAFINNLSEGEKLPGLLANYPDVKFSVKMRLGMEDPDEWKGMMNVFNSVVLDNIYVHPRVARQQYKGDLHLDSFAQILSKSKNSVVFNGGITAPEEVDLIISDFRDINGIMIARGILGRPSLVPEIVDGSWSLERRIETMLKFHNELFRYYKETLCGDSQILSKIKPFWEYSENEIGRKAWKAIKKASNLAKYNSALNLISNTIPTPS